MIHRFAHLAILLLLTAGLSNAAEDRDAKVHRDRDEVQATGRWIYNDLTKGITEAEWTHKPLLVVLRCIP